MPVAEAPIIVGGETPPPPPPPPKTEIHVTAPTTPVVDTGPKPDPPKPGSAKDRLMQNLQKRAKVSSTDSRPANTETAPGAPPSPGTPTEAAPDAPIQAAASPKPAETPPKEEKEKNPWRVVDKWKARATELESELVKIKSSPLGEAARQAYEEKISTIQKRADELENEIRFVNYEKSAEFQSKYEEPYKKKWAVAAKELSEITVKNVDGTERAATVNDLAEIVNLPLGRARAIADEVFGSFADDIMAYRKEILGLLDAKNTALEDARKNSIQRDKEREEQFKRTNGELSKSIKETWDKVNDEFQKDEKYGQFFRPVEGDQEGNTRLAKGFELVDRAFSENPNNPQLSVEERAKIVRRHAAVRNRAASWGRLHANYQKAVTELEAVRKELEQYKGTVPTTGGRQTTAAPATHGKASDAMFERLRKMAKPI